jgi:hypothetical protein
LRRHECPLLRHPYEGARRQVSAQSGSKDSINPNPLNKTSFCSASFTFLSPLRSGGEGFRLKRLALEAAPK